MKTFCASVGLLLLFAFATPGAYACQFTPAEWQQPVKDPQRERVYLRKHTSWSHDRDRDFIDDRIAARFKDGDVVNVIVDLNRCIPTARLVETFSPYGRIGHVGRVITYVMLDRVKVSDLRRLAEMEEVAMVEWQGLGRTMNEVSTRAVQSRRGGTYQGKSAQDQAITGKDVVIAILDSGVDDAHGTFAGRYVAGFDALDYEDLNPFDGKDDSCQSGPGAGLACKLENQNSNPVAATAHATQVAGTALGSGTARPPVGRIMGCSTTADALPGDTAPLCSGTAPGAKLVDIRVCGPGGSCDATDVAQGLDWLAIKASALNIRVANLSFAFCDIGGEGDDGHSAMAEQVNYLVALGITMAVAHGNYVSITCPSVPKHYTMAPGSSSLAITVSASLDKISVNRADDVRWMDGLEGPRPDFDPNVTPPNLAALKPDIAAPGYMISSALLNTTNEYASSSGTSMAAPHVAGAAALLLEKRPALPPGSLKELLLGAADPAKNSSKYPSIGKWDIAFGWGLLNVHGALKPGTSDVRFPSCSGAGWAPGKPCKLTGGLQPWSNNVDIKLAGAPQLNQPNVIRATVKNDGSSPATFSVNFGVYDLAVGNNRFFHIGSKRVQDLVAGETIQVSHDWIPQQVNHKSVQVSIDFGADQNFDNNVTQLDSSVATSAYEVQIENPFMVPARFDLKTSSDDESRWRCAVEGPTSFEIDPFNDCPRQVRVNFQASPNLAPGASAYCNIIVAAKVANQQIVIGGFTTRMVKQRSD